MREKVTVLFWLALMLLFPAVAGAENYLKCERPEGTNTVKVSYNQRGNSPVCGPIYADEHIEIVQDTTKCPSSLTMENNEGCFATIEKSDKLITLYANIKVGTTSSKINLHTVNINTTKPRTQPTSEEILEFLKNCQHTSKPNEDDIGDIENQFSNTCFFISEENKIWSWDTTDPRLIELAPSFIEILMTSLREAIRTRSLLTPQPTCSDIKIIKTNLNQKNKHKFINSRILHPNSPIKISTLNCSKDKKFNILIDRETYQGVPTIKTLGENKLIAEGTVRHISTSDQTLIPPRDPGPLTITIEEIAQQNTINKIKDSASYFVENRYKSFISIGTSISLANNSFSYSIKKDANNKDIISSEENKIITELTASYTSLLFEERSFNELYYNPFSFGISTTLGITNISLDLKNLTPLNSIGISAALVFGNNLSINAGFSLQKVQVLANDFKVGQPTTTNDIKNYTKNRFVITPQLTINLTPDIFKMVKSTFN